MEKFLAVAVVVLSGASIGFLIMLIIYYGSKLQDWFKSRRSKKVEKVGPVHDKAEVCKSEKKAYTMREIGRDIPEIESMRYLSGEEITGDKIIEMIELVIKWGQSKDLIFLSTVHAGTKMFFVFRPIDKEIYL